ncbi:MAG: UDP-N-acetylmuramoyl-L-alanine--D-glutamate ligase [Lachnospiraceae bacterium]|nr:UDP-N-acetylmuramoyl-L-alanine--D-glutamate ligase [Lachnospiraceae bacterium]
MNFKGKRVLVVGCGISGVAAAALLVNKGAIPTLFDENEKADREKIKERLGEISDINIILGKPEDDFLEEQELVVLSPGVPCEGPLISLFQEKKLPIIGEIELAYLCSKGRLLAITGTNGKTTTTALVGKIVEEYYESAFIVGNIGIPYTKMAEETKDESVTVAEISSFQLETITEFHPTVSAVLNITPDHLDRHHTMENYVNIKSRITQNQRAEEFCILNYEDPHREQIEKQCPATIVYFSSKRELPDGYYLKGEDLKYASDKVEEQLLNINEMKLLGIHNVENVLAAIAMTESFGIPRDHILKVVRNFTAVEHRIEYVATINDVEYFNDSKGTNPDAAIKAVQAMNGPTLLIGGGYDKSSSYDEWIESFQGKVKLLVLIGQTREKIAECANKHGFHNVLLADSLEEAVEQCYKNAKAGDRVLLSPACASWGMFPNYEVRGKIFKDIVNNLREN